LDFVIFLLLYILDLQNIKYILQRNDVEYNFTGRNMMSPDEMKMFLTHQPYLHLVQSFGQLDIYEYSEAKPFLYAVNPSSINVSYTLQFEDSSAPILNYTIINPTKIVAVINISRPCVLTVSASLDHSWIATFNDKQIKPMPVYSGISGFSVNDTGTFEVTIAYEPQIWFYCFSAISIAAIVFCCTYVAYSIWKSGLCPRKSCYNIDESLN
jgi:hypothetical protein